MKKLEKTLRSQMNFYGNDLRHGYYKPIGWTGVINNKKGFQTLRDVNVYYNVKTGKVVDVQIIGYCEAYDLRYTNDDDVVVFDMTAEVEDYLRDGDITWNMLINSMLEQIEGLEENYDED